jgi:hypothetical protein
MEDFKGLVLILSVFVIVIGSLALGAILSLFY